MPPEEAIGGLPADATITRLAPGFRAAPLASAPAPTPPDPAREPLTRPPLTLELSVEAEPRRVAPGDVLTYTVAALHTGQEPLPDITITAALPTGVTFVAQSASNFGYDVQARTLTWRLATLQPGAIVTGTFQARAQGLRLGEAITATVTATSPAADGRAAGGVVVTSVPAVARENTTAITAQAGGWLRPADGRVEVVAGADAASGGLRLTHMPGAGSAQLKLPEAARYAFTLNAVTETGVPVARSRAPLQLVYPLDAAELRQQTVTPFTFYAWDAEALVWQPLPTQVDYVQRTLTAATDAFTTYSVVAAAAAGGNSPSYQFDPGSRIKGVRSQLYSGSISYAYEFELPPGRGGLTPALGLSYSSARHQREIGHFNFAGHGWDILGENYAGKADPENPASSALTVVLNGATYTLNTSSPWFVTENPFVQTWEYVTPCINGVNGVCPTWLGTTNFPYYRLRLRTSDGTRYTFQGIALANSANPVTPFEPPMIYRWRDAVCDPGRGGQWPDMVRLPLTEVLDPNGNRIVYNWEATASNTPGRHGADDTRLEDHNCNYVRTVRLKEVAYNFVGVAPADTPQVRVQLRYDNDQPTNVLRWDRPQYFPVNAMSLYAIYKLIGVDINVLDDGGGLRTVRQYNLSYHDQCAGGCGDKASTLLLPGQIQESSPGSTPLVTAFSYDANKELTTQCDFGCLSAITGPYGGQVAFTAAKQAVNCTEPRPPAVTSHTVTDLVTGQAATWQYAVSGWQQKAHGYNQVNVLAPDLGDGTRRLEQHYFHQMTSLGSAEIDHLAGREYRTITCLPQAADPAAACATELQKTETHWQHSTADLPLDSVYIYLPAEQQPRFVYSDYTETYGETQRLLRADTYYQTWRQGPTGKQYGNLTEQRESVGAGATWASQPERTRYFWYYPTTVYWIFHKLAETHLYRACYGCPDASLAGVSKNYYDGAADPTASPTLGRLTQRLDGLADAQTTTQYTYWPNGNLRQVIDAYGRATETFYDSRFQAFPVCVKNAKGQLTRQRYYGVPGVTEAGCSSAAGDPVWSGAATTPVAGRFFGRLQDETDANTATTAYQWDSAGRISKVIRPGDNADIPTVAYAYYDALRPFRIDTNVREIGGCAGCFRPRVTFYDGLGQVIQTKAETINGAEMLVTDTRYNAEGQVQAQYVPYKSNNSATFWDYLALDPTRPKTSTTYDALGRPRLVTAPDSTTNEYVYGVAYNPADPDFAVPRLATFTIDANRHFVRQAYDPFGNLRTVSENHGVWPTWSGETRTRYAYDVADRLLTVQDHAYNQTTLTYDRLGRKTSMSDPDMGAWDYRYDAAGNLIKQRDARNQAICFYYDELNRLTGKTYHANTPNLDALTCPNTGFAVTYGYDQGANGLGRRTSGLVYENGTLVHTTSWIYDERGRVTSETKTMDGVSYVTNTAYDSADRPATLTYPADASGVREAVNYTYDAAMLLSQVRSTTHSLNYVTGLTYNALGQLTELTYGNNVQERRGYFGLGGAWDSRPGAGTYRYGQLWRLRARTAAGAPLFDLSYDYDSAGNITRQHETPRAASNWPTAGFTFQDSFNTKDAANWTWSSQQTVPFNDGGNNVVKSTGTGSNWSANFYRTSALTTGQGLSVRFKVDSTTVTALWAIETADSARRFAIYATGGKLIAQYNDGGGWRYPADLLTALQANTWYGARIVIDDVRGFYLEVYQENAPTVRGSYQHRLPTGLAWRFRHWIYNGNAYLDDYREFSTAGLTWNPDERMNFSYDALNRLQSAGPDSGAQGYSQTYQYDAIGNLLYKSDLGSYAYPPAGQARPHAASAAGANSYSYDANGNMLTRTENGVTYTQTWDAENRLKTVTVNGQTTTFVYDGDGQRVKKVQGGQTTVYIGDYYEKNLSTGVVTKYYYANGQRVAERQGSTVYYITGDHLGSTSLTTTSTGSEIGRQKYYPYGTLRSLTGWLYTDYKFTGQRSEEAALGSLYDYGARFYSPVLGRFISADSIVPRPGDPQSLNRYSYVLNNPLKYTDPTGHFFIPIAAMAVTGAIGAGAGFVGSVVGQVAGNLIAGASLEDSLNINWKDVGVATAVGATAGFLASLTATTMAGAIVTNAVASGVQYLASQVINERPVNAVDLGVSVGLGAAAGRIIGPLKSANPLPPDRTSPWLSRWAQEAKQIVSEDLGKAAVAAPAVARSFAGGITSNAPASQMIEKIQQPSRSRGRISTPAPPKPARARQGIGAR